MRRSPARPATAADPLYLRAATPSAPRALVGVVHLLPLPGAPRPSVGLEAVLRRAVGDATALAAGGADAVILENFGDAPFTRDAVDPWTIAAMTRIACAVQAVLGGRPLGINVLRNDALAALSIAHAAGAGFVRVNVLAGAMVTDQGVVEGQARALWLERNRIGAGAVRIVADVLVKHAVPLGEPAVVDAALDLEERAGADVIVVSGRGTGRETDADRVAAVRAAVGCPVWVGSGWRPDRAEAGRVADGVIAGTWLHADGDLDAPVDVSRVRRARSALTG